MFYHRQHLIEKQIITNKKYCQGSLINNSDLKILYSRATEQLRISKINNSELDFNTINKFLLLAPPKQLNQFYLLLKDAIHQILSDDKNRKIFQQKWNSLLRNNVMKLFNKIAKELITPYVSEWKKQMIKVYIFIIQKTLKQQRLWRVEQKLLECFVTEGLLNLTYIRELIVPFKENLIQLAKKMQVSPTLTQIPKTLMNIHYIRFGIFKILDLIIPNTQYLHNQLLHAPNPKYLFPLSTKKTFTPLTNEILLKLNKVDMVALKFWSLFQYQSSDIYQKIRKVQGWPKVDVLLLGVKSKLKEGLLRSINSMNEIIMKCCNKDFDEDSINQATSFMEIALEICQKHSETLAEEAALQKVDIGLAFQFNNIIKNIKLKQFLLKLIQLYFKLIVSSKKQKIKIRGIKDISINISKIIGFNNKDQKLIKQIYNLVADAFLKLTPQERQEFVIELIRQINLQWMKQQKKNIQIIKLEPTKLNLLALLIKKYQIHYYSKNRLNVLEFLFILSLNFKENTYFQAKKSFCYLNIQLGYSLAGSNIFSILDDQFNRQTFKHFRSNLKKIYGQYQFEKSQYEGLLAIMDEIVVFRIQSIKDRVINNMPINSSYFNVIIQFLQESQKMNENMNKLIKKYFENCIKTYMIQIRHIKIKDTYKQKIRQLIKRDVSFLIQSSASANPLIAKFSQKCLTSFIQEIPQITFHTKLLTVFTEVISYLYQKVSQQYDSKSQVLKGKNLFQNILIPANIKEISQRLIKILSFLYQTILRGHCIDDNYLKMKISYLVRLENTNTTKLNFGCKFLKYLSNNFKQDRQLIEKEVMCGNSCLWWINQDQFNKRLKNLKPEKFLMDKNLLPLHYGDCRIDELKKLFSSVQPQVQSQFLIVPPNSTKQQFNQIISLLSQQANQIQKLEMLEADTQKLRQQQNKMFKIVGRVKMLTLTHSQRLSLLSSMFQVAKKWVNKQLLKYILSKIVPYFYCIGSYNSGFLGIIAEMLHYITIELNNIAKYNPYLNVSDRDIFHLKLDYLSGLQQYEEGQLNENYYKSLKQINKSRSSNNTTEKLTSSKFLIVKLYQSRFYGLKKMHKTLLKFISQHMQVNLAKGVKLYLINSILTQNFRLKKYVLQYLPLETICYALKSKLQFVNVLKSSGEKGEIVYDGLEVDYFYYKTLKMGLYHFQKLNTFHQQELLIRSSNVENLKKKILTFIQVCNYLRNQDLHKIHNKKKLTKKDDIFVRKYKTGFSEKIQTLQRSKNLFPEISSNRLQQHKPQGIIEQSQEIIVELPIFRFMLLYLISERIDKAKAFSYSQLSKIQNPYSLAGKKRFIKNNEVIQLCYFLGDKSLVLIYNICLTFHHCLEDSGQIFNFLKKRLVNNLKYNFPQFLLLFIDQNKLNLKVLSQINYWKVPHIQLLLRYLTKQYQQIPQIQLFVTKILKRLHSQQLLFYLPQIFQSFSSKKSKIIFKFLLQYAQMSTLFAHQLIWISKVQAKQEKDPHNKTKRTKQIQDHLLELQNKSNEIIEITIRNMDSQRKLFFNKVNQFFENVTSISGKLNVQMTIDQKRNKIQEQLQKIQVSTQIYMPTNPRYQVSSIKLDSGIPMQSAAKCPILVTFYCNKYEGPDKYFQNKMKQKKKRKIQQLSDLELDCDQQLFPIRIPELTINKLSKSQYPLPLLHRNNEKKQLAISQIQIDVFAHEQPNGLNLHNLNTKRSHFQTLKDQQRQLKKQNKTQVSCIFKVFDDIRQDCLALQVIRLFLQIFQKNKLDLFLFPYKTISNRTGKQLNIGGIIQCVPNTVSRDGIGKINRQSLYQYFINKFGQQHNINFQQARDNFIKSQAAYSIVSYILQIKDRHNGNILINDEGYIIHIDFGFIFDISPANNLRFESANFKLTQQMIKIMGGSINSQPFNLYLNLVIKAFLVVRKYHQHIINVVYQMIKSGLPCFLQKSMQNLSNRFKLELNDFQAAQYMKEIVEDAADKWTTNWYDKIQWLQQKIYH